MVKKKLTNLGDITNSIFPYQDEDILELDELWSFVQKKLNKKWIWIAICKRTRQIVSYFIGKRDEKACRTFWESIPQEYQQSTTYSDLWSAYNKVITTGKHSSNGKEAGKTNHVERWNLTLRQRIGRFVRLSLSFSKNDQNHEVSLVLFIHRYNHSCINAG